MQTLFSLFTGGAAAGGAAAGTAAAGTAATAGMTAAQGFSLSQLLAGGATVLSMMSSFQAGDAEAEALEQQAEDAAREQPLETLQGIERRVGLKRAAADSIGALDVAYAASGTDLSFGTPAQARKDAYRELDLGLAADAGTQMTRTARLEERRKNYLRMAGRARTAGRFEGFMTGLSGASRIAERY